MFQESGEVTQIVEKAENYKYDPKYLFRSSIEQALKGGITSKDRSVSISDLVPGLAAHWMVANKYWREEVESVLKSGIPHVASVSPEDISSIVRGRVVQWSARQHSSDLRSSVDEILIGSDGAGKMLFVLSADTLAKLRFKYGDKTLGDDTGAVIKNMEKILTAGRDELIASLSTNTAGATKNKQPSALLPKVKDVVTQAFSRKNALRET